MRYRTKAGVEVEVLRDRSHEGFYRVGRPSDDGLFLHVPATLIDTCFEPADSPSEFVAVRREDVEWAIERLSQGRFGSVGINKLRSALGEKKPCEHLHSGGYEMLGNGRELATCALCGMVRERGWTSDWKMPEAPK